MQGSFLTCSAVLYNFFNFCIGLGPSCFGPQEHSVLKDRLQELSIRIRDLQRVESRLRSAVLHLEETVHDASALSLSDSPARGPGTVSPALKAASSRTMVCASRAGESLVIAQHSGAASLWMAGAVRDEWKVQ